MKLEVEAGASIELPSAADIARELSELSFPDNKFAILKHGKLFIQAYRNEDDTFTLEHSEGSIDRMFQYEPATLKEAVEAMQRFLSGADYRSVVSFQPLSLD